MVPLSDPGRHAAYPDRRAGNQGDTRISYWDSAIIAAARAARVAAASTPRIWRTAVRLTA